MVMECPAAVLVVFLVQAIHHLQRTFACPFLLPRHSARTRALIPVLAIFFNLVNGSLQGGWLNLQGPACPAAGPRDQRFLPGAALFLAGMAKNCYSDAMFRNVRGPGAMRCQAAYGSLYRRVPCSNYFGELFEWTGWAVVT